jgi:Domain of unknown function (DUF1844)
MGDDQGFRIIDKRRFAEGSAPSEGQEPAELAKESPKAASAASDFQDQGEEGAGSIDFSSLVVIYATQAMMLLGEIPEPQSGQFMQTDLTAARQIIDILTLLQEKTTGNLNSEETKLIQDVLTRLRLAFVGKAKQGKP